MKNQDLTLLHGTCTYFVLARIRFNSAGRSFLFAAFMKIVNFFFRCFLLQLASRLSLMAKFISVLGYQTHWKNLKRLAEVFGGYRGWQSPYIYTQKISNVDEYSGIRSQKWKVVRRVRVVKAGERSFLFPFLQEKWYTGVWQFPLQPLSAPHPPTAFVASVNSSYLPAVSQLFFLEVLGR